MFASLFKTGCPDWCRWLTFRKKVNYHVASIFPQWGASSVTFPLWQTTDPFTEAAAFEFQRFNAHNAAHWNVDLQVLLHYFHLEAWAPCLIQQGLSTVLCGAEVMQDETSQGCASLLTHCDESTWGEAKLFDEQKLSRGVINDTAYRAAY